MIVEESTSPEIENVFIFSNKSRRSELNVEEVDTFSLNSPITELIISNHQDRFNTLVQELESDDLASVKMDMSRGISIVSMSDNEGISRDQSTDKLMHDWSEEDVFSKTRKKLDSFSDECEDDEVEKLMERIRKQRSVLEEILETKKIKEEEDIYVASDKIAQKSNENETNYTQKIEKALIDDTFIEKHNEEKKTEIFEDDKRHTNETYKTEQDSDECLYKARKIMIQDSNEELSKILEVKETESRESLNSESEQDEKTLSNHSEEKTDEKSIDENTLNEDMTSEDFNNTTKTEIDDLDDVESIQNDDELEGELKFKLSGDKAYRTGEESNEYLYKTEKDTTSTQENSESQENLSNKDDDVDFWGSLKSDKEKKLLEDTMKKDEETTKNIEETEHQETLSYEKKESTTSEEKTSIINETSNFTEEQCEINISINSDNKKSADDVEESFGLKTKKDRDYKFGEDSDEYLYKTKKEEFESNKENKSDTISDSLNTETFEFKFKSKITEETIVTSNEENTSSTFEESIYTEDKIVETDGSIEISTKIKFKETIEEFDDNDTEEVEGSFKSKGKSKPKYRIGEESDQLLYKTKKDNDGLSESEDLQKTKIEQQTKTELDRMDENEPPSKEDEEVDFWNSLKRDETQLYISRKMSQIDRTEEETIEENSEVVKDCDFWSSIKTDDQTNNFQKDGKEFSRQEENEPDLQSVTKGETTAEETDFWGSSNNENLSDNKNEDFWGTSEKDEHDTVTDISKTSSNQLNEIEDETDKRKDLQDLQQSKTESQSTDEPTEILAPGRISH